MKDTIRSGTVERNKIGESQAGAKSVPGSKGVEYPAEDTSKVGTGYTLPTGFIAANASTNPRRSHGGQHTLTLFGIPGERGTAARQPIARPIRYSPEALAAREAADKAASEQTWGFYARLVAKHPGTSIGIPMDPARPTVARGSSTSAGIPVDLCAASMALARYRSEQAEERAFAVAAAGDYPTDYSGPCRLEVTLALES